MGRGSGGTGNGRGACFDLVYDFDLFTLQADGKTPTTFAGAIQNFNGSFAEDDDSPSFDFFQDDLDNGRNKQIDFTELTG